MGRPPKRQPAFLQLCCSWPFPRLGVPFQAPLAFILDKRSERFFKRCKYLKSVRFQAV